MKMLQIKALIFLSAAALSACSGGKTEYVDYAPTPAGPTGLDMKAAIYKATLPSGNILTITTDQYDNNVLGAYTIKNGSAIISSGEVKNLVSQLTLVGHKYFGSPCPDEAISISINPNDVNATRDEADIYISGQKSCSESLTITTPTHIKKFTPPVTSKMASSGIISGTSQKLSITVESGDNVNFVGKITLTNTFLNIFASGTIVGTTTNSGIGPVSGPATTPVTEISNATGFVFDNAFNLSGHFFSVNDNITKISGAIQTTTTTLGTSSITGISVKAFTDVVDLHQLDPSPITATLSYTPQ